MPDEMQQLFLSRLFSWWRIGTERVNSAQGPSSSRREWMVEMSHTHALFISVITGHKGLHCIDFSLFNELGRGPRLFFRFPGENVSETLAFVFYEL